MTWIRAAARRCPTMLTVAALTLGSTLAIAADEGAAPAPQKPVIAFSHAGLSDMFPDERDAGLVRAISMLGPRLKELKASPEVDPEFREVPDEAVDLFDTLLTRPMRMGVTLGEIDEETRVPHFGVVLSFDVGDQADADTMDRDIEKLRTMSGMQMTPAASERFKGMHDIAMPFGMLTYGPRKAPDGWRYELLFGEVENPDAVSGYLPQPTGISTVAGRGMLDLATLSPVTEMFGGMLAMFAPQGASLMDKLRASGVVGPDAMRLEVVSGYTATEGIKRFTIQRAGQFADALHLSKQPLAMTDLAVIPADATAASIKRQDFAAIWRQMRSQMEQAGQGEMLDQALAKLNEETGIDFENDVIASLGDLSAGYFSDTTGGGSLLSGVVAISLKDPAKMASVMGKLTKWVASHPTSVRVGPGAMRVVTSSTPTGSMTTLRLPGLPLPIEPSCSVAGNWLVLGASAQACTAAASQAAKGRDGGLGANPAFAGAMPAGAKPIAVSFVDTKRTMRSGYSPLSLLTTALSNFVSSPSPGGPEAPQILLPYNELNASARPLIGVTQWSGDNLVVEMRGDRSILVNAAGMLGIGDAGPLLVGAIIGGGAASAARDEYSYDEEWEQYEEDESGEGSNNDVEY